MHAWLIARVISNVMSPSLLLCSPARVLQFSQTQTFPCHTRKLPETHTHHFMTLWPDQSPHSPLSLKPRPLWILTVLHFKLNIPLVSLQHGFFYTVTNCAEYTFFPGSQSLEESASLLAAILSFIIKTFVRFLMAHTTHWNTHVHIWRRHAVNLFSAFSHPGPQGPPRSSGQLVAPGDQVK